MKKILILIFIPFFVFSQYEELENEIKKVISFQNKIDNHYDQLLEEYNIKYDEIEEKRDERDLKENNFSSMKNFYNAFETLKNINTPFIVLSEKDTDSFFMKFKKKRWLKKLSKIDGKKNDTKLINQNRLCVSIKEQENTINVTTHNLNGKKIEKIFKKIQKNYAFKNLNESEIIMLTKSENAVKTYQEIKKIRKEIELLQKTIFNKTESHIENAREKDKKSLNNQMEKYNVFLRGEIKRWSKRKKGEKPIIPSFEFDWSLN